MLKHWLDQIIKKLNIPKGAVIRLIGIGVIGIVLSTGLFLWHDHMHKNTFQIEFNRRAQAHNAVIQSTIDASLEAVTWVQSLYSFKSQIKHKDFKAFVSDSIARHPGIIEIKWLPNILHKKSKSFDPIAQRNDHQDHSIAEQVQLGEITLTPKREGHSPTRLADLERAQELGRMVVSARILMKSGNDIKVGFETYQPIYAPKSSIEFAKEQEIGPKGFAVGVYDVGGLVEHALNDAPAFGLHLLLEDTKAPLEEKFLYEHWSRLSKATVQKSILDLINDGPYVQLNLKLPNRIWTTTFIPVGAFLMEYHNSKSWMFLIGGLVLTIALLLLDISRYHLQNEVESRKLIENQLLQSQKMEAVGQLTSGLAHDFNNILMIAQTNIQLASEYVDEQAERDTTQEILGDATKALERGADITRRLLKFSRKQPTRLTMIDPQQTLLDLQPMIKHAIGVAMKLEIHTSDECWPIEVDVQQFENLILNLVLNSSDACDHNGRITISIENYWKQESLPSDPNLKKQCALVRLMVSDNGCGIPKKDQNRIFEPDFTTKKKGDGGGLGLSIVHNFMKEIGTDIELNSNLEEGTSITLSFPRAQGPLQSEPSSSPRKYLDFFTRTNKKILVVEDDHDVLKAIVSMISHLGFTVLTSTDGPSALWVLEENKNIDVVLIDIILSPDYTGFDLGKNIAALYPSCKLIYMSGYAADALECNSRQKMDVKILAKPFSEHQLGKELRIALGMK